MLVEFPSPLGDNGAVSDVNPPPVPAPMEYLDTAPLSTVEPPRRRRWVPFVIGGIAFVLVLVGVGLVVGDWAARSVEMKALVTQIEVSEHAMEETQAGVKAAVDEFRSQDPNDDANRTTLDDALMAAAAAGLEGVTNGGQKVAAVRVLPWHTGIKQAQDAYLAHNKAWQDYLAQAAKDPGAFGTEQEQVNSTFADAEQPIRGAVPSPDLFRLKARVDTIFAPPPADSSGPSQQA